MITRVIGMDNRMVATFDEHGQQLPEYQGRLEDVQAAILRDMPRDTSFLCHRSDWLKPFLMNGGIEEL